MLKEQKTLLKQPKSAGSFLIYISTDYVFNGEKGNYNGIR